MYRDLSTRGTISDGSYYELFIYPRCFYDSSLGTYGWCKVDLPLLSCQKSLEPESQLRRVGFGRTNVPT